MHTTYRPARNFDGHQTIRDKIDKDLIRLDRHLSRIDQQNLCAVFDVGTKGVRVIVGPKMSIHKFQKWNPDTDDFFYTASLNAQIGTVYAENNGMLDVEHSAFRNMVLFLTAIRKRLHFLKTTDFAVVGTAVFRWLENREEILEYLEKVTTLPRLRILNEKEEAYYSMLAINFTYNKIAGKYSEKKEFAENDVILLFDQGGGSTEVSYLLPCNPTDTELASLHRVGTVPLQQKFLRDYLKEKDERPTEKAAIANGLQKVEHYIEGNIDAFQELSKILPKKKGEISGYNVIAFGMGTALKVCFEQYFGRLNGRFITGNQFRGWSMKYEDLDNTYDKIKSELIRKYKTVDRVHNNLPLYPEDKSEDLDSKLQMLYGLKSYTQLMMKFRTLSISYAYFNLKYGVYLEYFVKGVKELYAPPANMSILKKEEEIKSAKQRVTILDGIIPGREHASYFHEFAMHALTEILGSRVSDPKKEKTIDNGLGRIDIVYNNTDNTGFFARLNTHYRVFCPKIMVECKNTSDVSIAAFGQIIMRFGDKRGSFGIIVCRFKAERDKVNERARSFYQSGKGLVFVLDDLDIKHLLTARQFNNEQKIDSFFENMMDEIIM